ncbi:MAG: hypothetical protein FWD15_05140 [Alphaproteobacteria bacterium]|nr:hypothetical protein [Alphaproteobacteria bacterium]
MKKHDDDLPEDFMNIDCEIIDGMLLPPSVRRKGEHIICGQKTGESDAGIFERIGRGLPWAYRFFWSMGRWR